VLSGPSGAGKSTVLKLLMNEYPGLFGFSVSHTTRKPRPGETHGVEYYFTTREEMEKMIAAGEFIETAEFSGNLYGTSKQAIRNVANEMKICVLDIEKKGCDSVRATDLNAKFIQVRPPSMEELEKRLRDRNTESDDSLRRRLEEATEALEYGALPGKFHHVIINETVEETYNRLKAVLAEDIALVQQLRQEADEARLAVAGGWNAVPIEARSPSPEVVRVTGPTAAATVRAVQDSSASAPSDHGPAPAQQQAAPANASAERGTTLASATPTGNKRTEGSGTEPQSHSARTADPTEGLIAATPPSESGLCRIL